MDEKLLNVNVKLEVRAVEPAAKRQVISPPTRQNVPRCIHPIDRVFGHDRNDAIQTALTCCTRQFRLDFISTASGTFGLWQTRLPGQEKLRIDAQATLSGRVSNIRRPSDVAGVYGAAGAGVAVRSGTSAIVLTNEKGAVLELQGRQTGLMVNADLSGLAISLK